MTVAESESPSTREQELEALVRRMQGELAATTDKLAAITSERDNLRKAYRQLMEQFELPKRRLFIAKAERVDATQLELEFELTKKKLDALAEQLGADAATSGSTERPDGAGSRPAGKPPAKPKTPGKGRRNLADRDDLPNAVSRSATLSSSKAAAASSAGRRVTTSATSELKPCASCPPAPSTRRQAQMASPSRAGRRDCGRAGGKRFTIVTAPLPPLLLRRGLLAPSTLAHVIVQKFRFGMPFFRQEEQLEADGIELDRGTMARSVEEVGACLGAIVRA